MKPVKPEDPPSLKERLRRVAEKCKLQQRGLAKLLGLTPPAITQLLKGHKTSGVTLQCLTLVEFVLQDHEPVKVCELFIGKDWRDYGDPDYGYRWNGPWWKKAGDK